jgi:zinc/manganese transport system substrate-binding protein
MRNLAFGALLVFTAGAAAQARPEVALHAVGLESQYANVMAQIGGPYVQVSAIEDDPNADPHEYELSPGVAGKLHRADVIVANGLGYDDWADKLLAAAPGKVIIAQAVRGLPDSTPNPHLWYDPATMPAVARAVAAAYAAKDPAHAAYYESSEKRFEASLAGWVQQLADIKARYGGAKVAVTEPVADYMLQAAGLDIVTPWSLQAAIMNGTDPAPQDVSTQQNLLSSRGVKIFFYNQQVTDSLTQSFLATAHQSGVPVLGVYELMPAGVETYQDWMNSETAELARDLAAQK